MRDTIKEELKTETEKFKTFVLLVIATVTGTVGLFLREDFGESIKIQVLFILGLFSMLYFISLAFQSYFNIDINIEKLKIQTDDDR